MAGVFFCPFQDFDLLTIGLVFDIWTEKSNDSVKYRRVAEQADFYKFLSMIQLTHKSVVVKKYKLLIISKNYLD